MDRRRRNNQRTPRGRVHSHTPRGRRGEDRYHHYDYHDHRHHHDYHNDYHQDYYHDSVRSRPRYPSHYSHSRRHNYHNHHSSSSSFSSHRMRDDIPTHYPSVKPPPPPSDFHQRRVLCEVVDSSEVRFFDALKTADLCKNLVLHRTWQSRSFIRDLCGCLTDDHALNPLLSANRRIRLFMVLDYLLLCSMDIRGELGTLHEVRRQLATLFDDVARQSDEIVRCVFVGQRGSAEHVFKVTECLRRWAKDRPDLGDLITDRGLNVIRKRVEVREWGGELNDDQRVPSKQQQKKMNIKNEEEERDESIERDPRVQAALDDRRIKVSVLQSRSRLDDVRSMVDQTRKAQRKERMKSQLTEHSRVDEFELYWHTLLPRWRMAKDDVCSKLIWDWNTQS